uniref:Innexin n=1 Tax=Panagrolaimus sp. JU765 TaxID=591449 RepID=A0AC34QWV6_9BILA
MEALICYAPKLIFKILYSFTDTQVTDVIEYAWKKNKDLKGKVLEKPKDDGKNDDSNPVTALITERLVFLSNKPKREANVRFEDYLTVIYFLMKILAICSIIFQLILLAFFIDAPDIYWGWDLFIKLMNGQDWRVNGYFPRVTFCDLETRDIGQHRPHTIQCVLMLNMFIEKIYLFLFFWFWTMLVISVANLLWWCWRVLPIGRASRMINDALEQSGTRQPDKRDIELFIRKSLHKDGIVILRLIDSNVGFIAMSDVCRRLWDNFFSKKM